MPFDFTSPEHSPIFVETPDQVPAGANWIYGSSVWDRHSSAQYVVTGQNVATAAATPSQPSARNALSSVATPQISSPDLTAFNRAAATGAAESGVANALAMASRLNPAVADQFYANLERAFPDYEQVFGQMSANTQSMLRGELPDDVEALVRQYAAEANMEGTQRRTARDLGRTSLDMATQGFTQGAELFRIASEYLTPPMFDVFSSAENIRSQVAGSSMLSPYQALSAQLQARGQDLAHMEAMAGLRQAQNQFNASMNWERTLSDMNLAYQNTQAELERQRMAQIEDARRAEQAAQLNLANRYLTMIEANGSQNVADLNPVPASSSGSGTNLSAITADAATSIGNLWL